MGYLPDDSLTVSEMIFEAEENYYRLLVLTIISRLAPLVPAKN